MSMKSLLHEWKNDFATFSKKESLLFLFAWLSTFKRSFLTFLKYFGWTFLMLGVTEVLIRTQVIPNQIQISAQHFICPASVKSLTFTICSSVFVVGIFWVVLAVLLSILFVPFFSLLSIRSSFEKKDASYFMKNSKKLFGFAFIQFILWLLFLFVYRVGFFSWDLSGKTFQEILIERSFSIESSLSILLVTAGLFFFDNLSLITSIKNAFKAFCMHLPLFFSVVLLYFLALYGHRYLFLLIAPYFSVRLGNLSFAFSTIVLDFFFYCAVAVVYLKIKHNDYKLFFN